MNKIIKLELAVVHFRNWKWFSRCKIENFLKAVVGRNTVKPAHCTAQYYFKECMKLGCCSITHSRPPLWDPMDCSTPGFPVLHNLPEVVQTHVHWVSDAIQPFHHLLLPSWLQTFPASGSFLMSWLFASGGQRTGASASALVLPMNIQDWFPLGLDWLDLLAVQETLKNLLQHHSSKASILQCSAFFMVQLSHPYMTTGKTIALTRWTFVGKVMSLFFNMLSRFVIPFLPRSNWLLISWLQSPSALILEPKKIVCHCFHCFPIYLSWSDGTGSLDLCFFNVEF